MPLGLKRFQQSKQSHFVTFSCNKRLPLLSSPILRDIFIRCLEKIRRRYQFRVFGYVVMPEHVHLLVSEPDVESLAKAIQALKVSFVRQLEKRPTSAKTGQMWGTLGIKISSSQKIRGAFRLPWVFESDNELRTRTALQSGSAA